MRVLRCSCHESCSPTRTRRMWPRRWWGRTRTPTPSLAPPASECLTVSTRTPVAVPRARWPRAAARRRATGSPVSTWLFGSLQSPQQTTAARFLTKAAMSSGAASRRPTAANRTTALDRSGVGSIGPTRRRFGGVRQVGRPERWSPPAGHRRRPAWRALSSGQDRCPRGRLARLALITGWRTRTPPYGRSVAQGRYRHCRALGRAGARDRRARGGTGACTAGGRS